MNTNHEIHESREKILFKDECYGIQGAIFDVYREMGCGFLEAVYQECLERELKSRNIPFLSQKSLLLSYTGQPLNQRYARSDLLWQNHSWAESCFRADRSAQGAGVQLPESKQIASRFAGQLWLSPKSTNRESNIMKSQNIRAILNVNYLSSISCISWLKDGG